MPRPPSAVEISRLHSIILLRSDPNRSLACLTIQLPSLCPDPQSLEHKRKESTKMSPATAAAAADDASCSSSDDSDSDVAFASMDFAGVNFDEADDRSPALDAIDMAALEIERQCLLLDAYDVTSSEDALGSADDDSTTRVECLKRIRALATFITNGDYVAALKSDSICHVLGSADVVAEAISLGDGNSDVPASSVVEAIRKRVLTNCSSSVTSAVEAELLGVAAFNLFLQINYTGPSLDDKGITPAEDGSSKEHPLEGINPHPMLRECLKANQAEAEAEGRRMKVAPEESKKDGEEMAEENDTVEVKTRSNAYHNSVLTELCVDGDWPCQVCEVPYTLLLARSILLPLADSQRESWSRSLNAGDLKSSDAADPSSSPSTGIAKELQAAKLMSARAAVAHQRLLQGDEPSVTLWDEVQSLYTVCVAMYCDPCRDERSADEAEKSTDTTSSYLLAAGVMVEWGLAQHHFNREGMGKKSFREAMKFAGLTVEVTGAEGRRTKYQEKATAQYLVKARSKSAKANESTLEGSEGKDERSGNDATKDKDKEQIKSQMIEHDDENILLERVKFVEDEENRHYALSELDLSILLALCLDVKNDNPMDGLTAEQMGGYLERILHQHDDWMIYATALLERAWLECERTHARERAILQIQALSDQHTNRLTMTQSTFKAAVEDSAPPQERLRNLHHIVYPPRWAMLRDLAERYAKIGVVTSAAEIFADLELWDEVVECYRIAGKENQAEKIVRQRLAEAETPRMWAALGDLTKDPECFEKALEISNGRFASARVALGVYYFEKGDLEAAKDAYQEALKVKPLQPQVWFRLGTVSMRLDDWDTALAAFTEVVQQELEEGDAWANIAAIHMHNKDPASAYPALVESLKQKRSNWRVWVSKLYTCIDLRKYDEALQACNQLLDFKAKKNASEAIPPLEEKVVRAIVGGSLVTCKEATESKDQAAIDSARRTLSRVRDLLTRLGSTSKSEPWVWEVSAFFNETVGRDDQLLEDLMKEYRALQTIRGWETDSVALPKICRVVQQLHDIHKQSDSKEDVVKFKFLLKGVVKKIQVAYFNKDIPEEAKKLDQVLAEVEASIANK